MLESIEGYYNLYEALGELIGAMEEADGFGMSMSAALVKNDGVYELGVNISGYNEDKSIELNSEVESDSFIGAFITMCEDIENQVNSLDDEEDVSELSDEEICALLNEYEEQLQMLDEENINLVCDIARLQDEKDALEREIAELREQALAEEDGYSWLYNDKEDNLLCDDIDDECDGCYYFNDCYDTKKVELPVQNKYQADIDKLEKLIRELQEEESSMLLF